MMEMSIKAPAVQAAAAVGGFMAFLAEVGAERDKEQQTKTRWALSYYAGKLAKAPAKPKRKPAGATAKAAKAPASPEAQADGRDRQGREGTRRPEAQAGRRSHQGKQGCDGDGDQARRQARSQGPLSPRPAARRGPFSLTRIKRRRTPAPGSPFGGWPIGLAA